LESYEITNTKTKNNQSPQLLLHRNKQVKDDTEIAKIFNEFYGSIADKTKEKIPPTNKNFKDYLGNQNNNSIFLTPTTPLAINTLINETDEQKAYGPSSIPPKCLKLIAPSASTILSIIFNESLENGSYPECLKQALNSYTKKNSKLAVGNYRPISLLSNINKVFEKLLHTRLVNFLDNNNIIYNNQFGFRKKHGTNHAMIALTELIRSSLDKNEFTAGIFIDLQKAFDTVEHKILKKLQHYGIRGKAYDLIYSYLNNRVHCVQVMLKYLNLLA